MSDVHAADLLLVPSRTRRGLLLIAMLGIAALGLLLAGAAGAAAHLAAAGCVAMAALCLHALLRREPTRQVRLGAAPRAEHVSAARIVLRTAQGRVVVWHDATDPDCYRRLAVAARWPARSESR